MTLPTSLRLMTLNCENLFLAYAHGRMKGKSQKLTERLAKTLLRDNPDVIFLSEVGGEESLEIFNKDYLDNLYVPSLKRGNSNRGIELGVLKKRSLELETQHQGHKNRQLTNDPTIVTEEEVTRFFGRDCLDYHIFSEQNPKQRIIVLFVHLKSQWDRSGGDFRGFKQRSAEVRTLVEIIQEKQEQFPEALIFLAGDFNGNAQKSHPDREFLPLYEKTSKTSMTDLFEWQNLPLNQRRTTSLFGKTNELLPDRDLQLDYFFFSEKSRPYVNFQKSGRIQYINEHGQVIPMPQTPQAKMALPSDHFPISCQLEGLESFFKP